MSIRRRIKAEAGRKAVNDWRATDTPDRTTLATAVRYALEELATRAPGNTVEVRVPPFGVTQCIAGPTHTRGTPPNVVETDADTWLALVTGALTWAQAVDAARVSATGTRSDLGEHLPLWP